MWLFTWREGGDGDADGKCLKRGRGYFDSEVVA